jgi:hypothetical protein
MPNVCAYHRTQQYLKKWSKLLIQPSFRMFYNCWHLRATFLLGTASDPFIRVKVEDFTLGTNCFEQDDP